LKFLMKQCPRCGGDLYLEQDIFSKYLACLQCGRRVDLVKEGELVQANRAPTTAGRRSGRKPVAPAA